MIYLNDDAIQQQHQKELKYQEANKTITQLGYDFSQELFVDSLIIGEYNKTTKEWTKITDPNDIMTTRVYMTLAQAKYYGVTIIQG